jgi:hypothetical protein
MSEAGKITPRKPAPTEVAAPKITKSERDDVMRVLRSREKTLKTMVVARAAELKTSFEAQISRQYDPRENPIWNEAVNAAKAAVEAAEAKIAEECERIGIPEGFRPGVDMRWYGRGENALSCRAELRALANAQIDEARKRALERIEITLSAAREKVLISGLGREAIAMLNEMPTLTEMMPTLAIDQTEHDLLTMSKSSRDKLLGSDSWAL